MAQSFDFSSSQNTGEKKGNGRVKIVVGTSQFFLFVIDISEQFCVPHAFHYVYTPILLLILSIIKRHRENTTSKRVSSKLKKKFYRRPIGVDEEKNILNAIKY